MDLCEQRPVQNSATFVYFNCQSLKVLKKVTFDTKKCFVQVINAPTHLFFLERRILNAKFNKKGQKVRLFSYLRGGTKLVETYSDEELKQVCKPVSLLFDRWLLILFPGSHSLAYDIYTQKHTEFPPLPMLPS